jgi:hypothetical protein
MGPDGNPSASESALARHSRGRRIRPAWVTRPGQAFALSHFSNASRSAPHWTGRSDDKRGSGDADKECENFFRQPLQGQVPRTRHRTRDTRAASAIVFVVDGLARTFIRRRFVQGHAIVAAFDNRNLRLLRSGGQYDNAISACVKNPEVTDVRRARIASERRARGRSRSSRGGCAHPPRGIVVRHPRGRRRNRPHLNLSGGSAALRQHTCKNEKRAFHRYSSTQLQSAQTG